jgi:hypothetical protein
MKWTLFVFCAGSLITLMLRIQDHEVTAGIERLAAMRLSHPSELDADPNLRLVTAHGPYMRTER